MEINMDKIPMWFQWVVFSCIHGAIIGLIGGLIALALGGNFLPWFSLVSVLDAGGVLFNVWADSKTN